MPDARHPFPEPYDPARAQRTLETLGEKGLSPEPHDRALLASLFGNSPYLARLALREYEALNALLATGPDDFLKTVSADAARTHEHTDIKSAMAGLRRAKRQAALATAFADVGGLWELDAVTGALSGFADACVGGALRFALVTRARMENIPEGDPYRLESETGFAVLAMGKYGAFELNYSSDIDLVVYYDAERFPFRKNGDARGAAVDITKDVIRLLSETTADGYVFRTDLRLRPDAGATQIAISTEAGVLYYESMGQNWERAAMIKARACAGDREVGNAFLKDVEPFVWRRNLDFAAIEDIHSIKRQMHAHGGHGAIAVAGHNIKLGRGGIREIEFFAQTQQLILGGRNPALRSSRTLDAIDALCARGFVAAETAQDLSRAYGFLRKLEHRLQMIEDQQTHVLPKTADELAHVACFTGFDNRLSFSTALTEQLETVQAHYARLFERAPPLGSTAGRLVFTGVEDDPATLDTLKAMGFREPAHAAACIRGWHHGRIRATRSSRAREILTKLIPALLEALGGTVDPDAAFSQFDRFVTRLPAGVQVFSLLLSNPHLLRLIAAIAGSAPKLADYMAKSPAVFDALLDPGFLVALPDRAQLEAQLAAHLSAAHDYEEALSAVRRFAKEQIFRVGAQVVQGTTDARAAGAAFASIAECAIAELLTRVQTEIEGTAGIVEGGAFAVIAMGKLGGREMTAGSDLDLIFVYAAPADAERSNGEKVLAIPAYYARLAQRLIAGLTVATPEGTLYDVDMRLRPTGNKGPVAVSLESFRRYYLTRDAWTWERLALTRARIIAGPMSLQRDIEDVVRAALEHEADASVIAKDARSMRDRLVAEFPAKGIWDMKFAPGGLVDIEFIAQSLQLQHGRSSPDILDPNSQVAIGKLQEKNILSAEDAQSLVSACELQNALTQVLRIALDGNLDARTATLGLKALLVRTSSLGNFAQLEETLARVQRAARNVFEAVLPGVA